MIYALAHKNALTNTCLLANKSSDVELTRELPMYWRGNELFAWLTVNSCTIPWTAFQRTGDATPTLRTLRRRTSRLSTANSSQAFSQTNRSLRASTVFGRSNAATNMTSLHSLHLSVCMCVSINPNGFFFWIMWSVYPRIYKIHGPKCPFPSQTQLNCNAMEWMYARDKWFRWKMFKINV